MDNTRYKRRAFGKAQSMRGRLLELAVDQDDGWMEKYLEGEEPDEILFVS